jgi:hypothetical protein
MTDENNALRDETDFDHYFNATRRLQAEVQRLTAERDRARDVAVALEQQTAEALRIALLPLDGYDLSENFDGESFAMRARRRIVRLLGDETETQQ